MLDIVVGGPWVRDTQILVHVERDAGLVLIGVTAWQYLHQSFGWRLTVGPVTLTPGHLPSEAVAWSAWYESRLQAIVQRSASNPWWAKSHQGEVFLQPLSRGFTVR